VASLYAGLLGWQGKTENADSPGRRPQFAEVVGRPRQSKGNSSPAWLVVPAVQGLIPAPSHHPAVQLGAPKSCRFLRQIFVYSGLLAG